MATLAADGICGVPAATMRPPRAAGTLSGRTNRLFRDIPIECGKLLETRVLFSASGVIAARSV